MGSARSEIGRPLPAVEASPASPTMEKAMERAPAQPPADAQRSLPTPFLTKTHQIVDDPAVDDVISWNEDGSTFVVWRPAEFARDLLPKYFKHNNFSSFVRQLNTYGFRKIVPDRWEFANDCFRRGEKQLLCDIHRRKVQTPAVPAPTGIPIAVPASTAVASPSSSADEQVVSPNSPSGAGSGSAPSTSGHGGGASTELVEENHRLRKENERLNHELSQMKNLCDNIVVLMSKYGTEVPPQHQQEDDGGGGCSQAAEGKSTTPTPPPPASPLELMLLMRCSGELDRPDERARRTPSPRLFGVPIGTKRGRVLDDEDPPAGASADDQPRPWRATEVKPEPADPAPDAPPPDRSPHRHHPHQHHRWRLYSSYLPNQRVCN